MNTPTRLRFAVVPVLMAVATGVGAASIDEVYVYTDNRPPDDLFGFTGHRLLINPFVSDPGGVPGNIRAVTAVGVERGDAHSLFYAPQGGYDMYLTFEPYTGQRGAYDVTVQTWTGDTVTRRSQRLDNPTALPLPTRIVPTGFALGAYRGLTPLLRFDAVPGAHAYDVEVFDGQLNGIYFTQLSALPAVQIPYGLLEYGKTYHFQVRANQFDFDEAPLDTASNVYRGLENRSAEYLTNYKSIAETSPPPVARPSSPYFVTPSSGGGTCRSVRLADCMGPEQRNLPTVVLTHGLQEREAQADQLWTGFSENQAGKLIRDQLGPQVNIVQYVWPGAFQVESVAAELPYFEARANALTAGYRLADQLIDALGADYSSEVHFIGHSLGTVTNALASRKFLLTESGVTRAQFTALDRPDHVGKLPDLAQWGLGSGLSDDEFERRFGFGQDWFASVLPFDRPGLRLFLDNYYSNDSYPNAGVGDIATGPIYNHPELREPHEIGDWLFASEGVENNHSGVQQWYRWTIMTNPRPTVGVQWCGPTGSLDPNAGGPGVVLPVNESLDPCGKGWAWSEAYVLNGTGVPLPPRPGNSNYPTVPNQFISVVIRDWVGTGNCHISNGGASVTCVENSSPWGMGWIDLPSGGTFLAFDYYFEQANSEDYVVLYIDDIPIWMLNEEFSLLEDGMQTELIPVSAAPGRRKFTVALFGDAALGSVFYLDGLRVGAPVPEASTCTLLAVGLGLLGFLVRRGRGSFAG